jgi:hypothetical protein
MSFLYVHATPASRNPVLDGFFLRLHCSIVQLAIHENPLLTPLACFGQPFLALLLLLSCNLTTHDSYGQILHPLLCSSTSSRLFRLFREPKISLLFSLLLSLSPSSCIWVATLDHCPSSFTSCIHQPFFFPTSSSSSAAKCLSTDRMGGNRQQPGNSLELSSRKFSQQQLRMYPIC